MGDSTAPSEHELQSTPPPPPPPPAPSSRSLEVPVEVYESDDAMWALYHRWCAEFRPDGREEDKKMRFKYFKDLVFFVRDYNERVGERRLGLTGMADMTKEEEDLVFGNNLSSDEDEESSQL